VVIWIAAYKSADIFGFFKSYSSLWFLPAGATIAMVMAVPSWFKLAPLIANLILAIPAVCWVLGIPFTNYRDPILHAFRLYAVYGGAALMVVYLGKVSLPIKTLNDMQKVIGATLVAAMIAAASGVSLHAVVGNMDWGTAEAIVVSWAVGDAIGAMIVPPLLVPILRLLFPLDQSEWKWPSIRSIIFQVIFICAMLVIGLLVPRINPALGSLWYLVIVPPVFFGLRGGVQAAATSVFLTSMLAPPAAFLFDYRGEHLELQLLLLISSVAGLLIGAAISDRQDAFTKLLSQSFRLEELVKERTDQLQKAYEFQRQLVRSIGHDLRQPLQSMNLMLDGLSARMATGKLASEIFQTRKMGETAAELLSKVLDYARSERGNLVPLTESFPIDRVFSTLKDIFDPIVRSKGVTLVIADAEGTLVSDEQLLLLVLSNYLDNAVRLSRPGMTIWLTYERDGTAIRLLVRDEIPTDEPHAPGAAGFGLAIVQHIAELLNLTLVRSRNVCGVSIAVAADT
jgi:signal transduction histidine kinase